MRGLPLEVKRHFLAKDRLLELAQRRARLDRQFLDKHLPGILIGGECIGLPAAAVQRKHQLGTQMLAQRMRLHQHLELADELSLRPSARSASMRFSTAPSWSSSNLLIAGCANDA